MLIIINNYYKIIHYKFKSKKLKKKQKIIIPLNT